MGYNTTYKLTLLTPSNPQARFFIELLDIGDVLEKPYSELRKMFKNVSEVIQRLEDNRGAFAERLKKMVKMKVDDAFINYSLEEVHHAWVGNAVDAKWYDHDTHLLAMSSVFPELVFRLEGRGEEDDDIWVKYYHDGKVQVAHATIQFEQYNPAKLAKSSL